jgi:hypothetical protein
MALTAWSRTAANNTNANTGINFDENQAPSTVNDSARELEAQLVIGIQDSTLLYLTGVAGTNTITATAAASMAAYVTGQRFHFIPANTNSGATTININSIGAKNIFFNGVACVGNEIAAGIPATITYDGVQFQLAAPAHAVTTDTAQTINGAKTFSVPVGVSTAGGTSNYLSLDAPANTLKALRFADAGVAKWDLVRNASSSTFSLEEVGVSAKWVATQGGGVQFGAPTGGDKGASTGNFAGLVYVNNVQLARISGDTLTSTTLTSPVINSATGIGQAIVKRKTADESVTSSTTLQDDDHLTFAIAANEEWECDLFARIGSNLTSTGVKVAITFPAGATAAFDPTVISDQSGQSRTEPLGTSGSGSSTFTTTLLSGSVNGVLFGRIWILNGATPGNVTLQWAQMTSNGSALTFSKGSKLVCHRIA